jgi:truncated hemoglobin YjbI
MTTATHGTSVQPGLFDRLGGVDAIERLVSRLLPRLAGEPALASLLPTGNQDALRKGLQLLLSDRLGGPMAYDGPDLAELGNRHGIDAASWRALLGHTLACLAVEAADPASLEQARGVLEALGASLGLGPAGTMTVQVAPAADPVRAAERLVREGSLEGWNLFVLNQDLVMVHQSQGAAAATTGCTGELKRFFGLGAADLVGNSILRFHPAPTRLQAILGDGSRLPAETTWAFGRVVWKAVIHPLRGEDGALIGFAMLWRDESQAHQTRAVVERLRAQSEDLPVPVMFPDASLDRWFGNAACEHALQRLAPHLSLPVNPLEGVPIQLFLPDEAERRALFGDPSRMPFKRQIRVGPETIAILVSAVLDGNQRYVVPQITWEIVHFTRPPEPLAEPEPEPEPVQPAELPPLPPPILSASADLRAEARALEAATQEVLLLSRLLLAVADDTDGQLHADPTGPGEVAAFAARNGKETAQVAEAALAVLAAAKEVPPGHPRREETARALATLTGIARRANRLALDGALLAVQDEAATHTGQLVEEIRSFARGLVERVRTLSARAQVSSDVLRHSSATAARLAALRSQIGDSGGGTG